MARPTVNMEGLPGVNVFSTKKISEAKLRKYQTASEKGISVYQEVFDPMPGTVGTLSPSVNGMSPSIGPPSKKQRITLKNSGLGPALSPATVAVTRRKRKPRHISLNDITFEDGITSVMEPEPVSTPEPESDESPLSSPPASENGEPEQDPEEDAYDASNMLSYYIRDDPEDENTAAVAPAVKAPKQPRKSDAIKRAPPPQAHARQPNATQKQPTHRVSKPRNSSGRQATNSHPQQALQFVPPPTVNIINNIKQNIDPNNPPTVAELITKLDILSKALVHFGGGPLAHQPSQENKALQAEQGNRKGSSAKLDLTGRALGTEQDKSVEGLLAMFESEDEAESPSTEVSINNLDYVLPMTGKPDGHLIYGISFIMNALGTWASQRIAATYAQQWHDYNALFHLQQQQQPRKGRGRPTKQDLEQRQAAPQPPPPPSVVNAELTNTPEGQAVQAFQDVLDCGILRTGMILPAELSRAMKSLYVQIDRLINTKAGEEPPWQCMSYQPQITTQKIKVERWKEHMAKMHAETVRQQEMAHQQMMMQMGVPPHLQHHGRMTQEQASRHHDMNLELKRGGQYANSQPHLSQYLTTPMDLDTHTQHHTTAGPSSATSPVKGGADSAPQSNQSSLQHINSSNPQISTSSRNREPFSNVKIYHGPGGPPGVSSEVQAMLKSGAIRPTQEYKFSTQATNPDSVRFFGAEAFAGADKGFGSNIPRRGPMGRPSEQHGVNGVDGHTPSPTLRAPPSVLGSNAPPMGPPPTRSGSDTHVNGANANHASAKAATATNGLINGQGSAAERSASPAQSGPSIKLTINGHKRKRSDTVDASASASPAADQQGSTSRRRSEADNAEGGVMVMSPDDAIVVE